MVDVHTCVRAWGRECIYSIESRSSLLLNASQWSCHFVVYDNEIADVLAAHASTCTAEEIATELVDATVPLMMQKNIVSPFSSRACDEGA